MIGLGPLSQRRLGVALTGFVVCLLLLAVASCARETDDQIGSVSDREAETAEPVGDSEEDAFIVESGQSEPGPPEPLATVDLDTARQQARDGGGGFWTLLESPGAAGEQTYRVNVGEHFSGAFTIGNYDDHPLSLAFTCIVDFAQTPCLEGTRESVHRVELDAQEDATLQLHLPTLSEGLHDVTLAMFMHPDEHATDAQFRADSRFMYAYDRVTLYVGGSRATPSLAFIEFAEVDELASQGMHFYTISREGPGQSEEVWHLEEASAGERIGYYILRNNPREVPIS